MSKIEKIVIANRGEIAVRIMQTAEKLGIKTVAVYSDADKHALHVQCADEAHWIGPPESSASYLDMDKIIEVAISSGAQAIHPGYGFLSENAEFSARVAAAGLVFIGPSGEAIRTMGSKLAAKEAVKPLGVPLVPGTDEAITSAVDARQAANDIGYPVLIKASAGGGGKGMRVVEDESQLEEQMNRAISEAESSFGDGSVFVEKYIQRPRHIEVQVLFDSHGNGVYLFDRECSIQRRHQKVIEEAPANDLPDDTRRAMGEAAIKAGLSVNYVGAGTVEFLVDENYHFYFLEMNTRLQVEHPVTELITGIDLVKEQIRIAEGNKLDYNQSDLNHTGHAIELRVYAEDPDNDFLPSTGYLHEYQIPPLAGIRVDHGYMAGQEIPIYYDPLLAKLISFGKDRQEAIDRMEEAITHFAISGVSTTLPFGLAVMRNAVFREGKYSTNFIKQNYKAEELHTLMHNPQVIALVGKNIFIKQRNILQQ